MTEQELTELAQFMMRIKPTDEAYSTTANRLAEGYLALKAERDALKVQNAEYLTRIEQALDICADTTMRLAAVEAERDRFKALSEKLDKRCGELWDYIQETARERTA